MSLVTVDSGQIFPEQGVRGIQIGFTDADGSPKTPAAITWTLTDVPSALTTQPAVVNSRSAVPVGTPAAQTVIVLAGDDLGLLEAEAAVQYAKRCLMVAFTFDSAVLGNNVTDYVRYLFRVEKIPELHAV